MGTITFKLKIKYSHVLCIFLHYLWGKCILLIVNWKLQIVYYFSKHERKVRNSIFHVPSCWHSWSQYDFSKASWRKPSQCVVVSRTHFRLEEHWWAAGSAPKHCGYSSETELFLAYTVPEFCPLHCKEIQQNTIIYQLFYGSIKEYPKEGDPWCLLLAS